MKILLTGFEPFGGESINPSWEAVKQLNGKTIAGAEIISVEMPVGWDKIDMAVTAAIEEHKPDAIISLGQSGGRSAVSLERVAVNRTNGKDNYDVERNEQPIVNNAPDAYLLTLPIVKMKEAICEAGVPAHISNTAGLYLCNYISYVIRHYIVKNNLNIKSGFVHIPFLPEQVAIKDRPEKFPSMSLDVVVKALEVAIPVVVEHC